MFHHCKIMLFPWLWPTHGFHCYGSFPEARIKVTGLWSERRLKEIDASGTERRRSKKKFKRQCFSERTHTAVCQEFNSLASLFMHCTYLKRAVV